MSKRDEFFSLPIVDFDPCLRCSDKPMPLSAVPIASDDLLIADDENGDRWIRTADGGHRRLHNI